MNFNSTLWLFVAAAVPAAAAGLKVREWGTDRFFLAYRERARQLGVALPADRP